MDYISFCGKFTNWILTNTREDLLFSRRTDEESPQEFLNCFVERHTSAYTVSLELLLPEWHQKCETAGWKNVCAELRRILGPLDCLRSGQPSRVSDYRKELPPESRELFDRLRRLRADLASEKEMPPYLIFSNRTLFEMCSRMPEDEEAFLAVPGVGEKSFSLYGKAFLEEINADQRSGTV